VISHAQRALKHRSTFIQTISQIQVVCTHTAMQAPFLAARLGKAAVAPTPAACKVSF
jgi:hypothetical protein